MNKHIYFLILFFFFSILVSAQHLSETYLKRSEARREWKPVKFHPAPITLSDSLQAFPDSMKFDMYGNLLYDDPEYNKKSFIGVPFVEVIGANAFFWSIDRYV